MAFKFAVLCGTMHTTFQIIFVILKGLANSIVINFDFLSLSLYLVKAFTFYRKSFSVLAACEVWGTWFKIENMARGISKKICACVF